MAKTRYSAEGNVTPERLRVAERALIAAAADQKELLWDENWQKAMTHVHQLINSFGLVPDDPAKQ